MHDRNLLKNTVLKGSKQILENSKIQLCIGIMKSIKMNLWCTEHDKNKA